MTERNVTDTSLFQQTLALLLKNVLLKWRRKWSTIWEWLQNLAFVLLMFLLINIGETNSLAQLGLSPAAKVGSLDEFDSSKFTVGYVHSPLSTREIMKKVAGKSMIPAEKFKEYEDENEMLEETRNGNLSAAIVFEDSYRYHIRYHMSNITLPNEYFSRIGSCDTWFNYCTPLNYWENGFLLLQASIDSAIIEISTNHSVWHNMDSIGVIKMRSLVSTWRSNLHIGSFLLFINLSFVSLMYLLSLYVSRERREMREILQIMRLRELAFWLSWALLYAVYVLIMANLMTLLADDYVFLRSSYGLVMLQFFLYGISSMCFTFMLIALIRHPRATAIAGFFITFFQSVLSLMLLMKDLPKSLEVLLSVFPTFAFSVGIAQTMYMEHEFQGVHFSDMANDSSHVLFSCIILIVDAIFYMILTLYFEKILADKHGKKYEPFFFLKSFWSKRNPVPVKMEEDDGREMPAGDYVENVSAELLGKEAVRINRVRKTYTDSDKKVEALRGLDLNIYEGQITALLGHSGAGKTTLLNILSGMCPVTSGLVSMYNYNISDVKHLEEIKKRLGFCPQFDVKFDPLTVKENLKVFAKIKGIQSRQVNAEVQKIISDLHMENIENVEASKLSGGQKRKLTLGIALLGDPQILLLDEPTAGLDPCSRHHIWAWLKEHKVNRVTLFSTQFMDEADILADRKAVISNGRLKCVGSSLFLKRKWGIGYHLRMQVSPSCDPEQMTSIIQQHIPSSKQSVRNEEQITYTLPFENMDCFSDLFAHLDRYVGQEIVTYGVSMTTLDDVFIKLEGEAELEKADYSVFSQDQQTADDIFSAEMEESLLLMSESGNVTLSGFQLWRQQVLAAARIRYLKLKHDTKTFRSILEYYVTMYNCNQSQVVQLLQKVMEAKSTDQKEGSDCPKKSKASRDRYLVQLALKTKSLHILLLILALFIIPLIALTIIIKVVHLIYSVELSPNLYFSRPEDRFHGYYTNLLIHNNTGSPIEDFVMAVQAQNIVVDVVDGEYDVNTEKYKGAIEVSLGEKGYSFQIVANTKATNILPVLVNIISNAYLKMSKSANLIHVWNNPILNENIEDFFMVNNLMIIIYTLFCASLSPHFAMSSISDNRIKARCQLRLSGLFSSAYWLGQALVDITFHCLLLYLLTAITFAFGLYPALSFGVAMLLVTIAGYGAAMVLYVYIFAFLFGKHKTHYDSWSLFFVLTSLFPLAVIDLVDKYIPGEELLYTFLFPSSSLGANMLNILLHRYGLAFYKSDLHEHTITLVPFLHIFLFSGIIWCLEWLFGKKTIKRDPIFRTYRKKAKLKKNSEVLEGSEDVLAEREKVETLLASKNVEEKPVIIVDSLRKEYKVRGVCSWLKRKRKVATKNISFYVKRGEVLGLLGPNGAGKTTSVYMLAGEEEPTAGNVDMCGIGSPASQKMDESTGFFGYCPQTSPLWPSLTVKEHLEIYAAVKGLRKEDANAAIRRVADALELKEHLGKAAKKLSTGVSRKVCFAISMLGNPTIVLLDEPSTGLDPKGQQRLWRAIRAAFKNKDRGAILTTHYMEEAEAVCDRVAIMIAGKLRCIGSIQQLKSKFGKDYLLEIKVKDSRQLEVIHKEIIRLFPHAMRQDRFSSLLAYKVPKDDVGTLSNAFFLLEEAKQAYNIEEYSFSQPTLEQVFIELAKEQDLEDPDVSHSFQWKQLRAQNL